MAEAEGVASGDTHNGTSGVKQRVARAHAEATEPRWGLKERAAGRVAKERKTDVIIGGGS